MNLIKDTLIIEKLLNSVKVRGYKKTLDLLSFEDDNNPILNTSNDKLIVKEITKLFKISNEDLFHTRYDSVGEIKYAIGFCVFYLYKYKTLGEIHKNIFKTKNKGQLSRYRQMIVDLDPSSKFDAKYIKFKNLFNKTIIINEKN